MHPVAHSNRDSMNLILGGDLGSHNGSHEKCKPVLLSLISIDFGLNGSRDCTVLNPKSDSIVTARISVVYILPLYCSFLEIFE